MGHHKIKLHHREQEICRIHDLCNRQADEICKKDAEKRLFAAQLNNSQQQVVLLHESKRRLDGLLDSPMFMQSMIRDYVVNLMGRAIDESEKAWVELPEPFSFIARMVSVPEAQALFAVRQYTMPYLARQCLYCTASVILGWHGSVGLQSFDQALLALCFTWMRIHRRTRVRMTQT